MIMEAGKSHDLPCTHQIPKKATGIGQPKSESLRTSGANGLIPSLKVEVYLSSCNQAHKRQTLLSSAICSIQAFNRLKD